MSKSNTDPTARTDLRTLDGHESWEGVYRLNEVDTSVEPIHPDPDTWVAAHREDRPERYREKHAQGRSS